MTPRMCKAEVDDSSSVRQVIKYGPLYREVLGKDSNHNVTEKAFKV